MYYTFNFQNWVASLGLMAELNAQEGSKWPQDVISARGAKFVWRDCFVWFILLRNGSSAPLTGPHMPF